MQPLGVIAIAMIENGFVHEFESLRRSGPKLVLETIDRLPKHGVWNVGSRYRNLIGVRLVAALGFFPRVVPDAACAHFSGIVEP